MRSGVGAFCIGSRRERLDFLPDFFFFDEAEEEWLLDADSDEADVFFGVAEALCCGCMYRTGINVEFVAVMEWCLGRELRIGCEGCALRCCDLFDGGPDFGACCAADVDAHTTNSHNGAKSHRMEDFILISTLTRSEAMPGESGRFAIIGHSNWNSSRHVCG
jgi:hypothetical protein